MTAVLAPNAGIPVGGRRAKPGKDMTPRDWAGLLEYFSEEMSEPEHAEDAPTMTKAAAGYVDGPVASEPCRACSMFRDGACTLVQGDISLAGHCDHWKARLGADMAMDEIAIALRHRDRVWLALDRATVRDIDPSGRMHVGVTNICKACVSPYKGDEIPGWEDLGLERDKIYNLLRPPEELERATPTSNGIQLLRKHVPVDADDHQPWEVAGAVGTSAEWDGEFVKNALTIWPAEDIDGVRSKRKMELSPGYHYKPVMEPGTYKGDAYDGRMTDIVFNHVALVEEGRQGADVIVADSAESLQWAAIEAALLGMGA